MSPEFRDWLARRAKPFELLAAVCRGDEIDDGGTWRRPRLSERMRAAELLSRKLLPDLQASKLPDLVDPADAKEPVSDAELARRIAFVLREAVEKK